MKKKMILVIVLVLLFLMLLINGLQGQELTTFSFTCGSDYLDSPEVAKITYVVGVIDKFLCVTQNYNSEDYSNLKATVDNMTIGQIQAIFDKYLKEHPEKWHYGAAGLFYSAIYEIVDKN